MATTTTMTKSIQCTLKRRKQTKRVGNPLPLQLHQLLVPAYSRSESKEERRGVWSVMYGTQHPCLQAKSYEQWAKDLTQCYWGQSSRNYKARFPINVSHWKGRLVRHNNLRWQRLRGNLRYVVE